VSEHIDQALCDLNTQLANLKARVRVLEARAELEFYPGGAGVPPRLIMGEALG
jgi:hypothetical protein